MVDIVGLADSWDFFSDILIFFGIAWRTKFQHSAGPKRWSGGRSHSGPAECLNLVVQAILKQNQNTQKKVPTTQPNPKYSAKNNVTMHMIDTFMPTNLSFSD